MLSVNRKALAPALWGVLLLAFVMIVSGCLSSASPPSPTYSYFHLTPGSQWSYSVKSIVDADPVTGDPIYGTMTMNLVVAGTAPFNSDPAAVRMDMTIAEQPGYLQSLYLKEMSGGIGQLGEETYSVSGATKTLTERTIWNTPLVIPATLKVGDTVSQSTEGIRTTYDASGNPVVPSTVANGSVSFTATGTETVTVPAGTFTALKTVDPGGQITWIGPNGVGQVKQLGPDGVQGMELISYTVK